MAVGNIKSCKETAKEQHLRNNQKSVAFQDGFLEPIMDEIP